MAPPVSEPGRGWGFICRASELENWLIPITKCGVDAGHNLADLLSGFGILVAMA
jgi:hypothetical protein